MSLKVILASLTAYLKAIIGSFLLTVLACFTRPRRTPPHPTAPTHFDARVRGATDPFSSRATLTFQQARYKAHGKSGGMRLISGGFGRLLPSLGLVPHSLQRGVAAAAARAPSGGRRLQPQRPHAPQRGVRDPGLCLPQAPPGAHALSDLVASLEPAVLLVQRTAVCRTQLRRCRTQL
eukprot:1513618-Rhodomonas_salina.1